jgi:hypothetical protein
MRKDARMSASQHASLRSLTVSTCLLASMLCLTPPARLHGHGENERQPTLHREAQLCVGIREGGRRALPFAASLSFKAPLWDVSPYTTARTGAAPLCLLL